MLLADPLSRLCAPGDGIYNVSLPGKISTLFLQNMPQQVAERNAMRVSAMQKWRKLISQGKLTSYQELKQRLDENNEELISSHHR